MCNTVTCALGVLQTLAMEGGGSSTSARPTLGGERDEEAITAETVVHEAGVRVQGGVGRKRVQTKRQTKSHGETK